MAGQRFTPGPGKTAPRLIEDLLDYTPKQNGKPGKNLLADPAPHFRGDGLPPIRKALNDCRHTLMRKNFEKEASDDTSRPNVEQAAPKSKYIVESYCSLCRNHFQVKISFDSAQDDSVICHLSNPDSPMHHLRLVKSMKGKEWNEMVGPEAFKYDPVIESHQFVCTAPGCPAVVEIRLSAPRLNEKLLSPITEQAKLYQRGQAQIREDPDRFEGQSPVSVYNALCYFRVYLVNASGGDTRRIAKRNKKYSLAFGDDCDSLFEYVGFRTVEGDTDPEFPQLGPTYFWQLPASTDQNRKFISDIVIELGLILKKIDPKQVTSMPIPALKDIERTLGYYDYPTRKRVIDLETVEHPYFASLGACDNFTDELLSWAYDRQRECDPINRPYYLDCLQVLANGRGSSDLQMKVVLLESAGELGLKAIKEAYRFFALDLNAVESDDHIMGTYKARIESAPRQKDEARRCLLVIAKHRDSASIEALANDRSMTFDEALEFLNVTSDTASDSIEASAIAMALDADKSRVANALRVIANRRAGDFTLQRAAASMESGNSDFTLDIGEAYNRLQIHQRNAPDETILEYYKHLIKDAGVGSRDSYKEAFRVIALDRQSNFLLRKLEDPEAEVKADTAEPVGLDNIGNTCYLNSLLQYYYTIKPVRDMVIDFQNHRMIINEENLRKKRAGGRIIEKAEIIKAQKFVDELHDLFEKLKTASTRSVKPTKELAELTIFSTEKENTYRRKSISTPHGPPTISSVLEGAVYGPQWPPPSAEAPPTPEDDIEMIDPPADKITDTADDSSEATLVDMDQLPALVKSSPESDIAIHTPSDGTTNEKNSLGMISTESKKDLEGDAVMVNGDDSPSTVENMPPLEKPPPIPPRNKSGLVIQTNNQSNQSNNIIADNDFWRFGVQQDVTEIIDNVTFRLQCAIKPTSIDSEGEQMDVIKSTFFGASTTFTQKAQSLDQKTEAWSSLIVFPGHKVIRDIYEAIDAAFDEQSVQVENSTSLQYVSISRLPPILQFQIQRTAYDKELKVSFKERTPVIFPETIYMDRYLATPDPDSAVMRRRRETWKWKKELESLEARQLALKNSQGEIPVTEALFAMKDYVKSIQEEEIDDIHIDPALPQALEDRITEVSMELEDLAKQINSLRTKLRGQFTDMTQYEYKLHSVFIHRGEAGGGHYWVYIYDFKHDIWREYNDENVTEVRDRRRIFDDQGNNGNPYFLVYVRSEDKNDLVEAVCRDVQEAHEVSMTDVDTWAGGVESDTQITMVDNGGFEQLPESSHIEHVQPRPLRPKPVPGVSNDWEDKWGPASEGSKDANGNDW